MSKIQETKYGSNYLENKIPYASNLIQTNQHNTSKQNFEKNGDADKKYLILVV